MFFIYMYNISHSPSCKTDFYVQTLPRKHPEFKHLDLLLRKHAIKSAEVRC